MDSNRTKDSSQEGTIVNPGKDEGRDTSVGDEGDNANELRFDEEQRLIREQSLRQEKDDRLIGGPPPRPESD
jgi:hypothetical protein